MIIALDGVFVASFLAALFLFGLASWKLGHAGLQWCHQMAWRGLITSAVDKIRAGATRTRAIAFLVLAVFVAWATIDSTPKIARLYTAHQNCGTWSASCPRPKSEPEWTYMQSAQGREWTRQCIKSLEEHGTHSVYWGRSCDNP